MSTKLNEKKGNFVSAEQIIPALIQSDLSDVDEIKDRNNARKDSPVLSLEAYDRDKIRVLLVTQYIL